MTYRQKTLAERTLDTIVDLVDNTGGTVSNTLAAATNTDTLTDNSGGTGNTTLTAVGGLTTLTDSTGLSGTHDDTLAATTVPAALTGGESPTEAEHNAVLTLLGVMVQNQSDLAQKVIEVVADLEDVKNNFADLVAQHVKQKAFNAVVLNAIASVADKVNDTLESARKD